MQGNLRSRQSGSRECRLGGCGMAATATRAGAIESSGRPSAGGYRKRQRRTEEQVLRFRADRVGHQRQAERTLGWASRREACGGRHRFMPPHEERRMCLCVCSNAGAPCPVR